MSEEITEARNIETQESSIFITNLTKNVKDSHLKEIFGHYGDVTRVELDTEKKLGQTQTKSATITFSSEKDAEYASFYMNNGQIDGNIIKVSFVLVDKKPKNESEPIHHSKSVLNNISRNVFRNSEKDHNRFNERPSFKERIGDKFKESRSETYQPLHSSKFRKEDIPRQSRRSRSPPQKPRYQEKTSSSKYIPKDRGDIYNRKERDFRRNSRDNSRSNRIPNRRSKSPVDTKRRYSRDSRDRDRSRSYSRSRSRDRSYSSSSSTSSRYSRRRRRSYSSSTYSSRSSSRNSYRSRSRSSSYSSRSHSSESKKSVSSVKSSVKPEPATSFVSGETK